MKKIGIIGTGNIGTDLLLKLHNKNYKNIVFVGRREDSEGIKIAKSLNIETSIDGIEYFKNNSNFDIIFECTNAEDAKLHNVVFKNLNITVIDLTPAKIGQICVPEINGNEIKNNQNINLITCGGQASLPLIYNVCKTIQNIDYIEVVSQIASKSAGMSTRINIDNYIQTTEYAISYFTGVDNCKVILNLNPAVPCVDMQTSVFMKLKSDENINFEYVIENVSKLLRSIRQYVPFYELTVFPSIVDTNILMFSLKVKGKGDYLPEYAGNLDIINCCAIKIMEML